MIAFPPNTRHRAHNSRPRPRPRVKGWEHWNSNHWVPLRLSGAAAKEVRVHPLRPEVPCAPQVPEQAPGVAIAGGDVVRAHHARASTRQGGRPCVAAVAHGLRHGRGLRAARRRHLSVLGPPLRPPTPLPPAGCLSAPPAAPPVPINSLGTQFHRRALCLLAVHLLLFAVTDVWRVPVGRCRRRRKREAGSWVQQ